jgi:cell wall-associated NlpC family hydrolase
MTHVLTRIATLAALVVVCALLAAQASAEPRHRAAAAAPKQHTVAQARKEQRHHPKRRIRRARPTLGERAARIAQRYLGVPYVYGGASPGGFDCSGLVMYVYSRLGVSLPHHAASQYAYGRAVPYARLKAGDLVFFSGLGHVGLYVGRGRFVDAPQSGDVVRARPLAERRDSFVGARRIVAA